MKNSNSENLRFSSDKNFFQTFTCVQVSRDFLFRNLMRHQCFSCVEQQPIHFLINFREQFTNLTKLSTPTLKQIIFQLTFESAYVPQPPLGPFSYQCPQWSKEEGRTTKASDFYRNTSKNIKKKMCSRHLENFIWKFFKYSMEELTFQSLLDFSCV